ncbi:MAG TPA: hypothetical protein PLB02_13965, partial [Thermoanaerobaculia bacterium]|nr:hypothetical protein [Thermoanaerobaculia bacterium]
MIHLALLALILVPAGPAPAGDPKGSRADFSGTWTLEAETGDAPAPDPPKGDAGFPGAGAGGRGRAAGGGSVSGITGLPREAIGDAGQLTVTDDGSAVRVERPNGRQRVLFTDGEERELDDGDGPAKVVVKRKRGPGGRIAG